MKIYWQVEGEAKIESRNSFTRREPKNNILRLLKGKEWENCRFNGKNVEHKKDGKDEKDMKEVRVIAGPNYNIPNKISEEYVLIINILWEDPIVGKEESKVKLKRIAEIDIDTENKGVKEIIMDIIEEIHKPLGKEDYKNEDNKNIIDFIYMPGNVFNKVYEVKDKEGKMNLTTLISKIYEIKNKKTQKKNIQKETEGVYKLLEDNEKNIMTLF